MSSPPPQTVLIFGAGLSGLAIAYSLSQQGWRVTVLDHPSWRNGCETSGSDAPLIVFGGHRETWRLLHMIGNSEAVYLDRTVPLEFSLPGGKTAFYEPVSLPGALQWIVGLTGFQGLAWHDRWNLLAHLEQIWEKTQRLPADLDNRIAGEWLASIGQSPAARERVWGPLSRWLTGNDVTQLSAAVFTQQLSTLFLRRAKDARLTFFHGSVGTRFIAPMRQAVERHGGQILSQAETPDLRLESDRVEGIRLRNGTQLRAQWYIAALSHRQLLPMLPEQLLARYAYFAQLGELKMLPEVAVGFQCRSKSSSPRLILLAGCPFHQLTIAPLGHHEISVRLSAIGNTALMELHDDRLITLGLAELDRLSFGSQFKDERSGSVSRNDQAALLLNPGASLHRPIQQSPIPNLLLAGPWTDTGWPANVESAISSARRCEEIVMGRHA